MSSQAQINCGKLNKFSRWSCLKKSATFTFKDIPGLRKRYNKRSESIKSDKIGLAPFLNGSDFLLIFYPTGHEKEYKSDHCSMFIGLDCVDHGAVEELKVGYTINLMSNGKRFANGFSDEATFGDPPRFEDGSSIPTVYSNWGSSVLLDYSDDFANDIKDLVVEVRLSVYPPGDIAKEKYLVRMPSLSVHSMVLENRLHQPNIDVESDLIIIKIEDGNNEEECIVKCSKRLLCCSSQTFRERIKMMQSDGKKYDYVINGYNCGTVKVFLSYVQSGAYIDWQYFQTLDQLISLLKISDEYLVTWMKDDVTNKIIPWMCIENAVECLVAADDAHCARLSGASINFCYQNYADLSITNEWAMIRKERPHLVISVLEEFSKRSVKSN